MCAAPEAEAVRAPPPAAAVPGIPVGQAYLPKGIIRVSGKTFVDDACREYTFSGWNQCDACLSFRMGF